jgi:flagellar biosynthesis component FlhA
VRLRDLVKADICAGLVDDAGQTTAILLDEPLEFKLGDRIGGDNDGRSALSLSAAEAVELQAAVRRHVIRVLTDDEPPPVLLTVPRLRQPLSRTLRRFDLGLPVLSFTELEPDVAALPGGLVSAPGIVAAAGTTG